MDSELVAIDPRREQRRPMSRGRWIGVILAIVFAWLVIGFVRAPGIATSAEVAFESGQVAGIKTTTFPALPPFMLVQVEAGVVTPGGGDATYVSSQVYLVEPFTGWAINLSHLGFAPSA